MDVAKKASRRLLWVVLLLTLPVPMWFIGGGRLPTLALLQIAAYMAAVLATEGGDGARLSCWVIGLQGFVWAAILYGVARLATAALARAGGGKPPLVALGVLVVALLALSLFDVYQAPIVARGGPVNIAGVY